MLREHRPALLFLLKYVLVYLGLNTAYGFYVESYRPDADPVTVAVTNHASAILNIFDPHITAGASSKEATVPITLRGQPIVEVFEGCNGVNVMVVFIAFIIAFQGTWKLYAKFAAVGLTLIYVVNLARVIGLFVIALKFPLALYFFHKFLFTGIIYLFVFALWYWWTVEVKQWRLQQR